MTVKSWMIGTAPLKALIAANPSLASQFFNTPNSFTFGTPPANFQTTVVQNFTSYAAYAAAVPQGEWVLYDNELWAATPAIEQQHPKAFMAAFCTLAHARGQKVILAPARNLMSVYGADCCCYPSESQDTAYLRCGVPAGGVTADVFEVQAQADQSNPAAYQALVIGAAAQLPAGFPLWAGLTTLRGDSADVMVHCYNSVYATVEGFWLNTSPDTIQVAAQFLATIPRSLEMLMRSRAEIEEQSIHLRNDGTLMHEIGVRAFLNLQEENGEIFPFEPMDHMHRLMARWYHESRLECL